MALAREEERDGQLRSADESGEVVLSQHQVSGVHHYLCVLAGYHVSF